MHHFSNEKWARLEGVVSPFFSGELGKDAPNLFWYLLFLFVSRTGTGDGFFLLEPRASVLKHIKTKNKQKEPKEGKARFLQGAERNAAYFGRFGKDLEL